MQAATPEQLWVIRAHSSSSVSTPVCVSAFLHVRESKVRLLDGLYGVHSIARQEPTSHMCTYVRRARVKVH